MLPNNASIIPGDSDRACLLSHLQYCNRFFPSHSLLPLYSFFLSSVPSKMSDWTSDANESLTLSLGKNTTPQTPSMDADGVDNSEITRGQRYPWRRRVIRSISPFLHISGTRALCLRLHIQLVSGFIQIVGLRSMERTRKSMAIGIFPLM